jgi:aminoglycoside phosphotransferase (APT) family kinase protein
MIRGAPVESRWVRPEPRRALLAHVVERIVQTAFPRRRCVDVQPLGDGLRNANFRLQLRSPSEFVVLRIYEHDASLCRKEADLLHLIGRTVPVPEVIHSEPDGWDELPPFVLLRYVEGITFRELKRSGDTVAISQAAYSAGRTLAQIGRVTFEKSGWLGPGPQVTRSVMEDANPGPRFADCCLASSNLQRRMPEDLRDRTRGLVWSFASEMASLENESRLVHGDFGKRNVLVRCVAGRWTVAAVLDWEFAFSGTPLADIGHFLRYECESRPVVEPHFSQGYLSAGGTLPDDWRRLARVIDVIALCESLTHDDLPDDVTEELLDLVRATVG